MEVMFFSLERIICGFLRKLLMVGGGDEAFDEKLLNVVAVISGFLSSAAAAW